MMNIISNIVTHLIHSSLNDFEHYSTRCLMWNEVTVSDHGNVTPTATKQKDTTKLLTQHMYPYYRKSSSRCAV